MVVPVLRGPLKGKKWIKGSHNVSIPLGIYETKQTASFLKLARNTNVFWDLGAHVGYYTLLFNAVSPKGKIYAFEPMADTVETYKKHMSLNSITNYDVFPLAVSDKDGSFNFKKTSTSVAGRLDESGETRIEVVKLSRLVAEKKIEIPDIIKMDIEGAEVNVLNDLKPLLIEKKPVLFVSTHGPQIHLDCIDILQKIGYQLKPLDTDDMKTSKEFAAFK